MIVHGVLAITVAIAFNTPWLIAQTITHGSEFFDKFLYDNIGRFIKSTRPNDSYRPEFYAFPIFAIIGLVPFTSHLLTLLTSKTRLKEILKDNPELFEELENKIVEELNN